MDPLDEPTGFNLSEYKQIIVAVIAGVFGVIGALLKRPPHAPADPSAPKKNPAGKWLLIAFVSLLLGGGLLAAERLVVQLHLDPAGDLSLENPGAILALAGSMLVAIGAVWVFVNLCRLLFGRGAPKDTPPPAALARGPGR